ncbi:translation initiation factor eIF-2B subunit delta-like isoform X2 [Pocillopora damicornis]|uniref:translation initiation factor eIF-2B subunit delta-like isoform X2 n=1 Tax=Pocillopora damicornis TaxID=46731 RepID=UPI000F558717|nr:translation initiation factor eIF-2B subunit delta-like isoform X2 [Pocillopora damicornis]
MADAQGPSQDKKGEGQPVKSSGATEGGETGPGSGQSKSQQQGKGGKQQKSGKKQQKKQKQKQQQQQQQPQQQQQQQQQKAGAQPSGGKVDKQVSGKDEKPATPGGEVSEQPQKTKAELKAERRAVQEAQRAAKAQKQAEAGIKHKTSTDGTNRMKVAHDLQADDEKVQKKVAKKLARQQVPQRTTPQKKVGLFSHLHQYEKDVSLTQEISFGGSGSTPIHPAVIKLGVQYAKGIICGSNARCVALLLAFKKLIADYVTPPQKELCRDLDAKIKPNISFLTQCRPLSVSMGNAIKYLKLQITHTPPNMAEDEAKKNLIQSIDKFIQERIILAGVAISESYARTKINDGDVILTYACSSLVLKILKDAHNAGKKFRVVVVDSRPKFEGRECLRRLVKEGIRCSYVLISAISYVIKEVSKVFLGAHALLANGYVKSRVGSSMVAMMAQASNVPVLVCCETYKFCDRVQTDSFVSNELSDPDDLVPLDRESPDVLSDWRDVNSLHLLNLVYDVTPPHFVSMVITEVGKIPCTSVPVVLRVQNPEQ